MAFSKIIYDGVTLMDVTQDTVTASKLFTGETAHNAAGQAITGTGGVVLVTETPDAAGGTVTTITTPLEYHLQANKIVIPTTTQQIITPDTGYDAFAQVTVEATPSNYYSIDDIAAGTALSGHIVINAPTTIKYAITSSTITSALVNSTTVATSTFYNCSALEVIVLTSAVYGNGRMTKPCESCPELKVLDREKHIQSFYTNALTNLPKLDTLILRRDTSLTLLWGGTSVFNGTPFASGGTGGTIYIPKVFYDHLGDGTESDYKAATNWSTIDGYGTITWAKIEGSQYEHYYADGTAIPMT